MDGVDFVEELKLRTWARYNFVSNDQRDAAWHPIILDEMSRRDAEEPAIEIVHSVPQGDSSSESPKKRTPRIKPPKMLKRLRLFNLAANLRG